MFAHDTEEALRALVTLVNAVQAAAMTTPAELTAFLEEHEYTGSRTGDQEELDAVRELVHRLARLWDLDESQAVDLVNTLLVEGEARPQLVRHGGWGWHLHATSAEAPLPQRMAVEAAMAALDVIRSGALNRLRRCAGQGCSNVFVDFSRNGKRRFCDSGQCGNRVHVAAYRARRRAAAD